MKVREAIKLIEEDRATWKDSTIHRLTPCRPTWLKEAEMATRLEAAVARVIAEGGASKWAAKIPHSIWPKPRQFITNG